MPYMSKALEESSDSNIRAMEINSDGFTLCNPATEGSYHLTNVIGRAVHHWQ
jgi:hypothetical protein